MLEIVQFPEPILLKKSAEVSLPLADEDQKLIDEMLKVMHSDPEHFAGLSAVQVGVLKRICICQRYDKRGADKNPEWAVMVNPKVTSKSAKMVERWDGCLSVKHGDLFAKTVRADRVTVEYLDRNGEQHKLKAKGFFSHVVQHEMDHLDGILFMKYVDDPSKFYSGDELDAMDDEE